MNQRRWRRWAAILAMFVLVAGACTGDDDNGADDPGDGTGTTGPSDTIDLIQSGESLLTSVRAAGVVKCGVNDAVPGFGITDADGEYSGFDIDYCRVIAAAVLGDADAVEYVPLAAAQRFTALQSGDIDVLVRNTTWTAARDGAEAAAFATTIFYDGQGMMVRADDGFSSIDDMEGATICVTSGTTTLQNLANRFNAADISYEPSAFEDANVVRDTFISGACDGWTSDKSQLAAFRSTFPESEGGPDALVVFDETFSKEPLGPAVRDGDSAWFDAVNWAILSTIIAEEFGITSANLNSFLDSDEVAIQRFLGISVDGAEPFDPGLNLDLDFAQNVIGQVGNYGEIFDRHVGPSTPLALERALNALWSDGGLLYAPPY